MAEKCELNPNAMHHYVAMVDREVRTGEGANTTVVYAYTLFCVQCGAKVS